jgi:hypothetical protein
MIRHIEILTLGHEARITGRHRGVRQRRVRLASRFFHKAQRNSVQEDSKPRPQLDQMIFVPMEKDDTPRPPMRVLLRDSTTRKFLGPGDRWTKDRKQARDFRTGWWATVCAFSMDPRRLAIHYDFDDERYDMNIPVLGL